MNEVHCSPSISWSLSRIKNHPNAAEALVMELKFDIEIAAYFLLEFLREWKGRCFCGDMLKGKQQRTHRIVSIQLVTFAAMMRGALFRYERFMRLKAAHPDDLLIPTLDIEAAWQSHLVRPSIYLHDMQSLFGVSMIEHNLLSSRSELFLLNDALKATAALWKKHYGEEYCDATLMHQQTYDWKPFSKPHSHIRDCKLWASTAPCAVFVSPPSVPQPSPRRGILRRVADKFKRSHPGTGEEVSENAQASTLSVPEDWKSPFGYRYPHHLHALLIALAQNQ